MIDQSGFSTGYAGDLVVHDRKPMTGSRRLMVVGLVAAAAMSAFLQHGGQTSSTPGIPVPPPLPAPTPEQPLPSQAAVVRAGEPRLNGYWSSRPLTFEDIASNLRKRGYGGWVPALRDEWGDVDRGHVTLIFYGDRAITYWDGRVIDERFAQLPDDSFVLGARGRDGFRVRLRADFQGHGRRMELTLERSSRPRTAGVPGEVFDIALFTTAPFVQRSRW